MEALRTRLAGTARALALALLPACTVVAGISNMYIADDVAPPGADDGGGVGDGGDGGTVVDAACDGCIPILDASACDGCGTPTRIATGLTPLAITTLAGNVYVLDMAPDKKANVLHLGPGVRTSLATGDYSVEGIGGLVNDGTRLYFSDRDKLRSILPDGSDPRVHGTFLCPEPGPVALDGTTMYMAQDCGRIIVRASKTSTGGSTTNFGTQVRGTSLASTTNALVLVQGAEFGSPTLHSIPKSGAAQSTLGTGHVDPRWVTVSGDTIFWVDRGAGPRTGTLKRIENAVQTTLASSLPEPTSVIVAPDGRVCWTNAGTPPSYTDGSIQCMPLGAAGQTPSTIVSGLAYPWGIAIDGGFVYWIERGSLLADGGLVFQVGELGRVSLP